MNTNQTTKQRRLAVVAVLSNLALVAVLALSLSREALVLLPVVALILPLLTAAAFEAPVNNTPVARSRQLRAPRQVHARCLRLSQAA